MDFDFPEPEEICDAYSNSRKGGSRSPRDPLEDLIGYLLIGLAIFFGIIWLIYQKACAPGFAAQDAKEAAEEQVKWERANAESEAKYRAFEADRKAGIERQNKQKRIKEDAEAAKAAAEAAEADKIARAVITANRTKIWALGWEQDSQVQDIGKFKSGPAQDVLSKFGKPDSAKPYGASGGAWTYTGLRGTDKMTYAKSATVFQPDSSSSVTFIIMNRKVAIIRFNAP